MRTGFIFKGRCWKFGDNIMNDGGLMHLKFVKDQEWDPNVLKSHCLALVNPEFPNLAQPGDLVIAGKRFGHGNAHKIKWKWTPFLKYFWRFFHKAEVWGT